MTIPSKKPTEDEINEALNTCSDNEVQGVSEYPGMTYDQGVAYAIRWMQGEGPNPFEG